MCGVWLSHLTQGYTLVSRETLFSCLLTYSRYKKTPYSKSLSAFGTFTSFSARSYSFHQPLFYFSISTLCVCVVTAQVEQWHWVCFADQKMSVITLFQEIIEQSPAPLVELKLTWDVTDSFYSPAKCSHNWWVSHDTEIGQFSHLFFSVSLGVTHLRYAVHISGKAQTKPWLL